ncbi:MAG TPA: FAD-binding oxidoreductase [Methylomirabilota bacterium]|jgi:FAD/FMN-containing dehydrogenase|nr:FAD-binding oxidoreductase [Methylomirabilota bacterium]
MAALRDGDDLDAATLEAVGGWGRHPVRPGRVLRPSRLALPGGASSLLPRGLGRAYGDAAVPASAEALLIETARADRILAFDAASGIVTCEAGVSLAELLRVFVPRGWFPPVTPGTKFVTIGGCVASDVHGKNHHREGSFGAFVERLKLRTADGGEVVCGPARERDLFLATVGGMGLTGLIVEATFRLSPVETPWIVLEAGSVTGLDQMLEGLRASARDWPYTVGWIDCLARGRGLGRGVLMRGRHASREEAGGRVPPIRRTLRVRGDAPEWLLNPSFVRLFNRLYHVRHRHRRGPQLCSYEQFFYPLDAVLAWNRLYGRRGFLQYQCVVPQGTGSAPLSALLEKLGRRGASSFLAVIKDFGPGSEAYLSFPVAGTTLSLDLPYRGRPTEDLIHELNALVLQAGGRIYLAKDAVTRAEDFACMMPRLGEWKAARDRWDPQRRFRSAQSVRLFGDPA